MSGSSGPQQPQVPKHRCCIQELVGGELQVFCDDVHNEGTLALNNLRFDCRAAACQVCLDLNFNHFPGYASSMEIFWMNLVSSAKEGCESCSILEEGLRLWSLEISSPKKSYLDILPTGRIKIYHIRDAPLSLHFLPNVVEEGDLYLQFYTVSENFCPWPAFGAAKPMKLELNAQDCVSFINERLKQCDSQHSCFSSPVSRLPTRIINVGSKESPPYPKLEDGSGREAKYIALSHCWGSPQTVMKTTKATLSTWRRGIPWIALPKTFQDAIEITRLLDVQYLWIYSLCILQDDPQDWQNECSLMQDVYSKSLLTLAATGASDSNGGCLFWRTIGRTRHLQLGIERRSISPREIYRVIKDKNFTVFVRSHPNESHSHLLKADIGTQRPRPLEHQAPLMRRAWALQERLLAPRVLHFHPEEMMWQCREEYACECGDLQRDNTKTEINGLGPLLNLWKPPASVECIVSLWYKIVNYYAELSISYDNDRLPALSGIASLFSTQLTGGYIVGLWRQDLVRGLMWSSGSHFASTSRIDSIPTWCWASVKIIQPGLFRPIFYNWRRLPLPDYRVEIMEAHYSLAGSNAYGNVTIAFITIKAPAVFLKASNVIPATENLEDGAYFVHLASESEIGNRIQFDIVDGSPVEIEGNDVLCCVLLAHVPDSGQQEGWSMGLILKKTHSGLYFRVGTIDTYAQFFQDAEMKEVTII